jgi:hypothetical protein
MDPFSQKNFQKISSLVLYPLFDLSICHIGGDTGGGTPTTGGLRGYATPYSVDNLYPPPRVTL